MWLSLAERVNARFWYDAGCAAAAVTKASGFNQYFD
jgi:hypothetical protein